MKSTSEDEMHMEPRNVGSTSKIGKPARKGAVTNCYDADGNLSKLAVAFCDLTVDDNCTVEATTAYADAAAPYATAIRMIREAIGEIFDPVANLESEDAVLLRGPEPHHAAEAIISALQNVAAARKM